MNKVTKITARWIYPVFSPPIENGMLIIKGGKIVGMGKHDDSMDIRIDEIIDLPRHILMPGLINAHTHLELSKLKGKIRNSLSFAEWIKKIIQYINGSGNECLAEAVKTGLDELILHGATTVADISISGNSLDAMREKNIRGIVFYEVTGFKEEEANCKMHELKEKIEGADTTEMVRIGISPHSVYSVSPLLMQKANAMAKKYCLPAAVHVAETHEENAFVSEGEGDLKGLLVALKKWDEKWATPRRSPINYLDACNALDGILAVHCNYAGSEDISILKKSNASVVFCPLSNLWFKRKMAYPLLDFLDKGVNVCLGTDSLASNEELNLFKEMREVKRLFPDVHFETIIEMTTIRGAAALCINDITGDLHIGKDADVIALEADGLEDFSGIAEYIVNYPDRVVLSMVKGCVIMNR